VQRHVGHDDGVKGRGLVVAVLGAKVQELVRLADALRPLPLRAGGTRGPLAAVGRNGALGSAAQGGGAAQAQQLSGWLHGISLACFVQCSAEVLWGANGAGCLCAI